MNDQLNWTLEEFSAFLLIHVSYADLEFCETEKSIICDMVGRETFDNMVAEFEAMSAYAQLQRIRDYKSLYFDTPERKTRLLEMVRQQFAADGAYSRLEKNLMLFLEKWM